MSKPSISIKPGGCRGPFSDVIASTDSALYPARRLNAGFSLAGQIELSGLFSGFDATARCSLPKADLVSYFVAQKGR